MGKKKKSIRKWYKENAWWLVIVGVIFGYVVNFLISGGIDWLDNIGLHILGIQFTTFEYDGFERMEFDFLPNNNYTKNFNIINKADTDLIPYMNITLFPNDDGIIIRCKELYSGNECKKKFPIDSKNLPR